MHVLCLQGEIEKTDELLMSDEPEPEPRKRRVKAKQGKSGSPSGAASQAGLWLSHPAQPHCHQPCVLYAHIAKLSSMRRHATTWSTLHGVVA